MAKDKIIEETVNKIFGNHYPETVFDQLNQSKSIIDAFNDLYDKAYSNGFIDASKIKIDESK